MPISKNELMQQAAATGFQLIMLEKVWRLMDVLDRINEHPYLKNRLVLKGGTALNLFMFDLPRLSIDIDLNYIGALDKVTTQHERPLIEKGLEAIFNAENLMVHRMPNKHAGGKWLLKYTSVMGGNGNLAVDVNFMFRIPLATVVKKHSCFIGGRQTQPIALLDVYELGAGKLSALFNRRASRDLFDAYELLTKQDLDFERLRLYCMIYGGMGERDWRLIAMNDIHFDKKELQQELIPVLPKGVFGGAGEWLSWTQNMLFGCRNALSNLLPLRDNEKEFFKQLYDHGEVQAGLLTGDEELKQKVMLHPLLKWKAQLAVQNKK